MADRNSSPGTSSCGNVASSDLQQLLDSREAAIQAAREAVRDTTRLTRLISILNDSGPLEQLLDKALTTLSELFLADVVILLDPVGTGSFAPLAAVGLPEEMHKQLIFDGPTGHVQALLQRLDTVLLDCTLSSSCIDLRFRDLGVRSLVILSVAGGEEVRGVLMLGRCSKEPFPISDIPMLTAMAHRLGKALTEAQRSTQTRKILEVSRHINQLLDVSGIGKTSVAGLVDIVGGDAGIFILQEKDGRAHSVGDYGLDAVWLPGIVELARGLMHSESMRRGQPLCTTELTEVAQQNAVFSLAEIPFKSMLAIPLLRKEDGGGLFIVFRRAALVFNAISRQAALLFVEHVAAALENSHLYQTVQNELRERKRLEEEQRRWERQRQQLEKAESLNRMAGAIAHHFNNMLFGVIGNIDLALADSSPTARETMVLRAKTAAQKAAEVSSLMLTYLGQSVARLQPCDLSEVCRLFLTAEQWRVGSEIAVHTDFPASGPIVKADRGQVQLVLRNLLMNAVEAFGNRQGLITLAIFTVAAEDLATMHCFPVDWQPENGTYACIEVGDDGPGLEQQVMDRIFDPFFSTKFTGRGLGLPVVLGIVRAHQGAIAVENQRQGGCVFRIFLPVEEKVLSLPETPCCDTGGLLQDKTVLLVEDDQTVRFTARKMLELLGCNVLEAEDGNEAIVAWQENKETIELVLCDVTMPVMDGQLTLAALRRLSPGLPVILSSGYDESHVLLDNSGIKPDGFLHKPYQLSDLKTVLSTVLAGK